ncbi:MAG: hypothetical protein PUA57_04415 [Eggerthellales bacterium]|nr:hypothetical protein [Eggerthellales bacterium]
MDNSVSYNDANPFEEGTQAEAVNASTSAATKDMIAIAAHTAKGWGTSPRRHNNGSRTDGIPKSSSIILGLPLGTKGARSAHS